MSSDESGTRLSQENDNDIKHAANYFFTAISISNETRYLLCFFLLLLLLFSFFAFLSL